MSEPQGESSGVLNGSTEQGGDFNSENSQNQGERVQNTPQNAPEPIRRPSPPPKVQKQKEPFKLLHRGYGFNPLILLLVFSLYFFGVATANLAITLNEYPQIYIPGVFDYVGVQKLSDMQFNRQLFNITGQYFILDANGAQQLQRTVYTNVSGTFDQKNQNWYISNLLIPFRVNTKTEYNISISYGFPAEQTNIIDIVIPNQLINEQTQEYTLMRPNTIILEAQESFNRSYLSYNSTLQSSTQQNQYFVGIKSVDIRIFYRNSKKIKLYTAGINPNYSRFQSALAMFVVSVFLLLLSLFLMMYGFSRIGQQMIVIRMYAKAKEGGSSYLNLKKGSFETTGVLWRKYNRGNAGVNQYPPLMYE